MSNINKVPASAGAEWLLAGFALLRRAIAPMVAVSSVGLFVMLLSGILALFIMVATASVPFPLSLLPLAAYCALTLGVPCLVFAGVTWASREVAYGRPVQVQHLLVGGPHFRALLVTSLVPLAGMILSSLLLIALIGNAGVEQTNEVLMKLQALMANGAQPDPAEVEALIVTLPVIRFFLWMLLTIAMAPVLVCLVMVAVSEIVFSGRGGVAALRLSIAANAKNFTALLVFSLLLAVMLFAMSVAAQLVGLILQIVLGPIAAVLVTNMFLMTLLMPVLAGAAYTAWRQMLAGAETPPAAGSAPTQIEV